MKVTWNHRTGHATDVLPGLRRSLSQYARYSRFKIGITGNPDGRAAQHRAQYTEMIVLYGTSSRDYVRHVETILIEDYVDFSDNERGGGGGLAWSFDRYYLYIVR